MTSNSEKIPRDTSTPGTGDKQDTLEKIRWSLRQRLSAHMRRLISDLFEELDDFLFYNVPPDQLSEGSRQLQLIREFRNKKQLFEEKFLGSVDNALQQALVGERSDTVGVENPDTESAPESGYDRMELEIALERMQGKALKHYLTQRQTLTESARASRTDGAVPVIPDNRDLLINSSLRALSEGQVVFRLSLDNRLVFFKLFEKHFLLNMDRLYQEVIRIVNNKDNSEFVDRLYLSSTLIFKRRGRQAPGTREAGEAVANQCPLTTSEQVEQQVNTCIESWCAEAELPEFIESMLRTTWHSVLFLLGLNTGVNNHQWEEACETVSQLTTLLKGHDRTGAKSLSLIDIEHKLKRGFELSQWPAAEQQNFFVRLREHLEVTANPVAGTTSISRSGENPPQVVSPLRSFAAVSEAGRKILNSSDLDDFVALLSDDQAQEVAETDEEAISMDYYLNMVDTMADGAEAILKGESAPIDCRVHKSRSIANSYQILDTTDEVLLTRSRVGLAVSLRAGEVRLHGQEDFKRASAPSQLSALRQNRKERPTTH